MDDPVAFANKVNEVCEAYRRAPETKAAGGHTVSFDEMTGIQALERKCPDKPVMPGRPAYIEFEYIRHGTQSLIGFFDVATGQVPCPYIESTRTEEDLVKAIRKLVETDPDGEWTFICDGLNTHRSEGLVRFVAEACHIDSVNLGMKGKSGILKDMASRTAFLHDESHRIRFIFTPKHCSWMNQIEIWFGIINRQLLKRGSYTSVEKLKSSILRYIEQYNVTAKPFSWTYKGIPLAV